MDEAFGLALRQVEDEPQGEDGLDGEVGVRSERSEWSTGESPGRPGNVGYFWGRPRLPLCLGAQARMASSENQMVMSPLFLSDLSYAAQLVTRYFFFCLWLRFRLCASFIVDSWGLRSLMDGIAYVRVMLGTFMHQRPTAPKGSHRCVCEPSPLPTEIVSKRRLYTINGSAPLYLR